MRTRRSAVPVLLLGALALSGCPKPAPKGVRIAVHSDPLSLDPHEQNEVLTFSLLSNVYEALTSFDAELKIAGGLAESWTSPDERTWRFRLRQGQRFHDGRPVTAEDVVFSLERARTHPRSQLASYLVEMESVRAVEPLVVEIRTRRSYAVLLNKLASVFVVPKDTPETISKAVGSGPYRVVSFERGRHFRLERVAKSGKGADAPPSLEFLPVGSSDERLDGLLKGEYDLAQDPNPARALEIEAAADCRLAMRPSAIVEYLHMQPKDPRFADRRVRMAVHLALDRALIVQRNVDGRGLPATQLVAPGIFGFDGSFVLPPRDVARARQLLAEAGFPNGFDVTLTYRMGRKGEEIARQLGEIGLRVTPESGPYKDVYAKLRDISIPFYYGGIVAATADASDVLDSAIHSRTNGYGQSNFAGASDPALDRLIEASGATFGLTARREQLKEAMGRAMDDFVIVPLYIPYDVYGVKKGLVWEPRLDRRLNGAAMRWR